MLEPRRIQQHRRGALQQPGAVAIAARSELLSAKNLDFVSLALCSCVLTLLCHSAATLPQPSSLNGPTSQATTPTTRGAFSVFQPFTLTSAKAELETEESQ